MVKKLIKNTNKPIKEHTNIKIFGAKAKKLNEAESTDSNRMEIVPIAGLNSDGFKVIIRNSAGEEVFNKEYRYGHNASYDRRFAKWAEQDYEDSIKYKWKYPRALKPYVADIIDELCTQYGIDKNDIQFTPGENVFAGEKVSDEFVARMKQLVYESAKDISDYRVKFFQIFEVPKSPKENGKMIGQRGTLDDANAFGKEKVGEGNYIIKAVCDDGKTRPIDNDTKASDFRMVESIEVATIADYIVDHYDFDDIDDRYGCINSIKDSFKGQETISEEELEQFIGAHNGRTKVEESYAGIKRIVSSNLSKIIGYAFEDGMTVYEIKKMVGNELDSLIQQQVSNSAAIPDISAELLGIVKPIKESTAFKSGDRIQMDYYARPDNGAKGTVLGKIGELYSIEWDDGTRSKEIKGFLKLLDTDSKTLEESKATSFYVTVYEEVSTSGPEEGGYTYFGWEATHSKPFNTEDAARKYLNDFIDGAEVIYSAGDKMEIKDEYGDTYLIAIESANDRGSNNVPARSWAEAEMDVKFDRPFFDNDGNRLPEDPAKTKAREEEKSTLENEYLDRINALKTMDDIMTLLSDSHYGKFVKYGISDKYRDKLYDKIMEIRKNITDESLSEAIYSMTNDKLAESKNVPANCNYDKGPLEADLLALDGVDKLDWDLTNYNELPQVIVLVHREFEDSSDLSDYYEKRKVLFKSIMNVFKKHNLKLADPVEDQGTWWYFVLEEIEG